MSEPQLPLPAAPAPETGPVIALGDLALRLDQKLQTADTAYTLQGQLTGNGAELYCDGGSLQIQNATTGLVEEAYFTADGRFQQALTLAPETDTRLVLALCDGLGDVVATVPIALRHRSSTPPGTSADGATPTLPRDLAIEVRGRTGRRLLQVLAPAGVSLPGRFSCQCRTTDQSGRVVVPLWEETHLVHQLVVNELDPNMPPGIPVDIDLQIEVDRAMTLRVLVRQAGRGETLQLPAPVPFHRPASEEIDATTRRLEALLREFTGQYGSHLQEGFRQRHAELKEALDCNRDEQAGAAFAALGELRDQMELAKLQVSYPPLQRLTQLVKQCLFAAANLADRTGRDREQLFSRIYAQEEAVEQAHAEKNATLYRECFEHLQVMAAELQRTQQEMLPINWREQDRGPSVHDVTDELKNLQAYLAVVMPSAQLLGKLDVVQRLEAIDQLQGGLADRAKRDAPAALRDARRAVAEVAGIEQALTGGRTRGAAVVEGMLEGSA